MIFHASIFLTIELEPIMTNNELVAKETESWVS